MLELVFISEPIPGPQQVPGELCGVPRDLRGEHPGQLRQAARLSRFLQGPQAVSICRVILSTKAELVVWEDNIF